MRRVKKAFTRRHRIKWAALGGALGSATALLQYIPQSWPTWVGLSLTVAAFVLAAVSSAIEPSDDA